MIKNTCSVCGGETDVNACGDGFVCEPCADKIRVGRDSATRQTKLKQRALRGQADKLRTLAAGGTVSAEAEYAIESSAQFAMDEPQRPAGQLVCGEALHGLNNELVDTLAAPGVVALDASANRLDLLTAVGTDVAAMALDASDTIVASNSLEKMLAHQMAVCHDTAMKYVSRANMQQDPQHATRMMNLSIRAMETFQKGLLTLKRLRTSGEQHITIEHVNVSDGGQAVIGNVQPRGTGEKS